MGMCVSEVNTLKISDANRNNKIGKKTRSNKKKETKQIMNMCSFLHMHTTSSRMFYFESEHKKCRTPALKKLENNNSARRGKPPLDVVVSIR